MPSVSQRSRRTAAPTSTSSISPEPRGIRLGHRLILAGLAVAWSNAFPQNIDISGKVSDGSGHGISGVSLRLLAQPISALSGLDGSYRIKRTTTARLPRESIGTLPDFSGDRVRFLLPGKMAVSVTVGDAQGRVLRNSREEFLSGVHEIKFLDPGTAPGLFFVSVRIGEREFVRKGIKASGLPLYTGPLAASPRLAKGAANAVDTLEASLDGYRTTRVALDGFTGTYDIVLDRTLSAPKGGYEIGNSLDRAAIVSGPLYSLRNSDYFRLGAFLEYSPTKREWPYDNQLATLDSIRQTPIPLFAQANLRVTFDSNGAVTSTLPEFEGFDAAFSFNAYRPVIMEDIALVKSGSSALGPLAPDEVRSLKAATIAHAAEKGFDVSRADWKVLSRLAQWRKRPSELKDVVNDVDGYALEAGRDLAADFTLAYNTGNWDPNTAHDTTPDKTLADWIADQKADQKSWMEFYAYTRANGKSMDMTCPLNGLGSPLATHDILTSLKQTLFWMEDSDAVPDLITPRKYHERGVSSADLDSYPETDTVNGTVRAANTVSGAVYWLLRHRDAPKGDLDLMYWDTNGAVQRKGIWSEAPSDRGSEGVALPERAVGDSVAVPLRIMNASNWMEYTPVLKVTGTKNGWTIRYVSMDGATDYTDRITGASGLVLTGPLRLMADPGGNKFNLKMVATKTRANAGPLIQNVMVFSHLGSKVGIRDVITFSN